MTTGKKRAAATQGIDAIRTEEHLAEATRELCELMSSKTALSGADKERFQRLVNSIEAYEDVHYPIPEPSHAALLQHLLNAKHGSSLEKLAKVAGVSLGAIKAILSGKRQVWHGERKAFAKYFSVEPSVFDPEPDTLSTISITIHAVQAVAHRSRQFLWFRITSWPVAPVSESKHGPPARPAIHHAPGIGVVSFGTASTR